MVRSPNGHRREQASPAASAPLSAFISKGRIMPFACEKPQVYQQAVDFADLVLATTDQFPGGYAFLVDQLNRSALSFAANRA